jgi:hypothetical protein
VVDALGARLMQAAGRAACGPLVQNPDPGLNAADDKEEGFKHGASYNRPAGGIKPSLAGESLSILQGIFFLSG